MLNKVTGNMYEHMGLTHTWNTVKGKCPHDCSYCYMKKWGKQNTVRFDEKEFKTDLGEAESIFIGSSCDMWAEDIPQEWINKTLTYCDTFSEVKWLFQTKNPKRVRCVLPERSSVCVTMESDIWYPEIMRNCPNTIQRSEQAKFIRHPLYITIEPIMKFNLREFVELIAICDPLQVNIGADSKGCKLPEPTGDEVWELIHKLEKFTVVKCKANLGRLIK